MITTILLLLLIIIAYIGGFVSGEMWKDFIKENENVRKDD